MDIELLLPLLFLIGLVASFLGNFISGGTSLIALTAMLFIGVPPYLAIATYAVGAIAFGFGGVTHFSNANKIVWKLVLPLVILCLIGSAIGATVLTSVDEVLVGKIVGFSILLFIPFSFIKKDLGVKKADVSPKRKYAGYLFYFLTTILAGFVPAGAGIIYLYVYMWFFGLTLLEIKGTSKIPTIFANLSVAVVLLIHGVFNPVYLLAFVPGMFIGSSLGAKYVLKLGDRWLKIIVLITIALMALKLIFF